MGKKTLVFTVIIGALFAVLAGCDNDPEQNRAVVTVSSLNNNTPLLSDVWEQGDSIRNKQGDLVLHDDHIREDWIPVVFFNKPYNAIVTTGPGAPHGDFLVTRYRVHWERTGGGLALPDFEAGLGIMIPSGKSVEGMIQLVTFENKSDSLLHSYCYYPWDHPDYPGVFNCVNAGGEIFMTAHITFYGHEVGTDHEGSVEAQLGVAFTDLVVETADY